MTTPPVGGIDLGGTKIEAIVLTSAREVAGQARRPTPTTGGPAAVAAAMVEAMRAAAQAAGSTSRALGGVGVGSPGEVDSVAGTVTEARNLPGWTGTYALGAQLKRSLGTTVRLGNDVHVATQAEYLLGAARGFSSVLGVFWGTGVGGSLILDGRMWEGRGAAGEIGHMVVVDGGAKCTCGRRGCMEAYAGRAAMELEARRRVKKGEKTDLFAIMKQHGAARLTSGIWQRALEHKDKMAVALIDRAVEAIAAAVASAVNLLDVEAVVVGGGLGVRLGGPYLTRIERAMKPHLFVDSRPPAMRVAELGDLGGAIGAALLVTQTKTG